MNTGKRAFCGKTTFTRPPTDLFYLKNTKTESSCSWGERRETFGFKLAIGGIKTVHKVQVNTNSDAVTGAGTTENKVQLWSGGGGIREKNNG